MRDKFCEDKRIKLKALDAMRDAAAEHERAVKR